MPSRNRGRDHALMDRVRAAQALEPASPPASPPSLEPARPAADGSLPHGDGSDFTWLTGFECSTFPQQGMDQLELTQHDRFWASDLLLARDEAACRTIRYGIRWHIVNPQPGIFDWSSLDGPMAFMRQLGMEPIVDLFHFGTPTWLERGVLNPAFPDAQAELARGFVRRYPWVRWFTPTNEPYILSQFGGESGGWYPHGSGPADFARALEHVSRGLVESWCEIIAVRPDARCMTSDTGEFWHAADDGVRAHAERMNERRFLVHELVAGRVGAQHPLRAWLGEIGLGEGTLRWFAEHAIPLDIIGLDHYPHSEHRLRSGEAGEVIDETMPLELQHGPGELARQYFDRLRRPLIFAETGAPGSDEAKVAWLDRLVDQIRIVRSEGVPVIGITWWGLLDQVDWGNGLRRFRYDIDPTGLYRLEWQDGQGRRLDVTDLEPHLRGTAHRLARVPTGALAAWRTYALASSETTVGRLAPSGATTGLSLW
jgi:beta-glucosidase